MPEHRSGTAEQIADLLRTARSALGPSLAFLSRMDGAPQHLEAVESPFAGLRAPGAHSAGRRRSAG